MLCPHRAKASRSALRQVPADQDPRERGQARPPAPGPLTADVVQAAALAKPYEALSEGENVPS